MMLERGINLLLLHCHRPDQPQESRRRRVFIHRIVHLAMNSRDDAAVPTPALCVRRPGGNGRELLHGVSFSL